MGLNLWFGGHVQGLCWLSSFFYISGSQPRASPVRRRCFSRQGWREVCYRHLVLGRQECCSKVHTAHSQPPHLRVTPVSYDNGGVVEKPGSAAREMNLFSIPDQRLTFSLEYNVRLFLKPKQSKLKRGGAGGGFTFACSTGTDGFVTDQRPRQARKSRSLGRWRQPVDSQFLSYVLSLQVMEQAWLTKWKWHHGC